MSNCPVLTIPVKNQCSSVNHHRHSRIFVDLQGNVYDEFKNLIGVNAIIDEESGSVRYDFPPDIKDKS